MAISTLPRHSVNGRGAKALDILRLGDTTEEKRPVQINGKTLWAWVTTNGRYPSSVAAELDDARNRWMATRKPLDPEAVTPQVLWNKVWELSELFEGENAPDEAIIVTAAKTVAAAARAAIDEPQMKSSEVDWQAYLTDALCILIPGLDYHDADLLMPDARLGALYELGYMRPQGMDVNPNAEGGEPQAPPEPSSDPGESSTGDEPGPGSAASTE
jgi:hypothetical protein